MSRQLSQDEVLAGRAEIPTDSGTLAPAAAIHPNFDRGLSKPDEKQLTLATIAKHQHLFAPKPQTFDATQDYMQREGRWVGVRGVADHDLTVSERKCIAGAERNRGRALTFPERKELLTRFRADMAKFAPAKPIRVKPLPTPKP
jgi:hypothetical protein